MVRALLDEMVKSPLTAGDRGVADTVRVTASEEGPLREAVTMATPPFSSMEGELTFSVAVGVLSSSAMVRVRAEGSLTPWPPLTAARDGDGLVRRVYAVVDGRDGHRPRAGGLAGGDGHGLVGGDGEVGVGVGRRRGR